MAKPITVHTVESLRARCDEVGDCWIWRGYSAHGYIPQVQDHETRKMTNVRGLMSRLLGKKPKPGGYWIAKCEEAKCVRPEHAKHITHGEHVKRMAAAMVDKPALKAIKAAKISMTKRKVSDEAVALIMSSNESAVALAQRLGISPSTVKKYRLNAQPHAVRQNNPWAGLMAART